MLYNGRHLTLQLNSPAAATSNWVLLLADKTGTVEKCGTPRGRAGLSKQEAFVATAASWCPDSSPSSRWIETSLRSSCQKDCKDKTSFVLRCWIIFYLVDTLNFARLLHFKWNYLWSTIMSFKKQNWGWMRHVLTALSVIIFVSVICFVKCSTGNILTMNIMPVFVVQFLGCIVIGYMAWVLATSTTVNRFLSGTLVHKQGHLLHCFIICFRCPFIWICALFLNLCSPLDFYVYGDRFGIFLVRQRADRLGRYSQPKYMASSFGTLWNSMLWQLNDDLILSSRIFSFSTSLSSFSCLLFSSDLNIQFLGASVLCILGEIGGIITLNIVRIQVSYAFPPPFLLNIVPTCF